MFFYNLQPLSVSWDASTTQRINSILGQAWKGRRCQWVSHSTTHWQSRQTLTHFRACDHNGCSSGTFASCTRTLAGGHQAPRAVYECWLSSDGGGYDKADNKCEDHLLPSSLSMTSMWRTTLRSLCVRVAGVMVPGVITPVSGAAGQWGTSSLRKRLIITWLPSLPDYQVAFISRNCQILEAYVKRSRHQTLWIRKCRTLSCMTSMS